MHRMAVSLSHLHLANLFADHPYNGAWPEIRRLDGTVVRP
jgi:hypothetical protein